ncbi:MAG: hypothetical protein AAFQ87_05490 [Bacteroidota bacterium]
MSIKTILLFLLCLVSLYSLKAQFRGAFAQVGGSYLQESDGSGFANEVEASLRTSIGLEWGKHWTSGIRIQQVWYRASAWRFERMWMIGPFVRWGTAFDKPGRFFVEAGYMRGNYCTCRSISMEAYREEGLHYFSWGGGVEVRVIPGMYVEGEIFFNHILRYPEPTYGYNGYLLGLVFHLSRGNLSS